MLMSDTHIAERVEGLQDYIRGGRILDAMKEFYAPNVTMQENNQPPTVGLGPCVEHEKEFLSHVKQWIAYDVRSINVGTDTSAVESTIEFVDTDDKHVKMDEVAVQRWRDGKIISERFYYDPGQR